MLSNKFSFNFKVSILFIILILASLFFYINSKITNQFRHELNKQVQTVVNIYHDKVLSPEDNSDYLLEVLVPLIDELDIPMIITTQLSDGSYSHEHINIEIPYDRDSEDYKEMIENIIYTMDQNFDPLPIIEYDNIPLIQIHYGDTNIINTIKWIPYIELAFAIILLISIIIGYRILNLSEKNLIYAGMAKETAHQLGTPISSLMGWSDLLKKNSNSDLGIIKELDKEIEHLKNISDKFNKIGSTPNFSKIKLNSILDALHLYFCERMPESTDIKIKLNINKEFYLRGDYILLYWSLENIIKNSIDSIKGKNGLITINVKDNEHKIELKISDNGIGIKNKDRNKIFKPGYSTKNRGWGLGLSLSKRIIEDFHKGSIKLIKSKKDETVFLIYLKSFYS